MSRKDCVSNRNTKIILTYVESILGGLENLLEGIEYPAEKYEDARSYFMNEDEWDTHETYRTIYYRAKELVGDPNFFFNCGRSSGRYQSWGSFKYFIRALGGPKLAYGLVPKFSKNFNDTLDIFTLIKPHTAKGKVKATFKIEFHKDIDPHSDYCGNLHTRGILTAVPEVWGLAPAKVDQPLVQYDPLTFLNQEFSEFNLNAQMEDGALKIKNGYESQYKRIGKEVILVREKLTSKYRTTNEEVYLGKYQTSGEGFRGVLVFEDLIINGQTILERGTIFNAPYFIVNVECEELKSWHKIPYFFKFRETRREMVEGLMHNTNQARMAVRARNEAFQELKKYADRLEDMVKERTSELESAYARLSELDKVKSKFFANVSHEIRTPLTLIISPIESILQGDYSKKLDESFFKSLHSNAIRLLELINTMLDFSKIEAGRMSMKVSKVDIVETIKNLIGAVKSACETKDISISFITLNKSVDLYIDINKFDKIVMNLLSNALKFTERGGRIDVKVRDDEEKCYLELEDSGIGIPDEKLKIIFDRYSQVHITTGQNFEGSGIGLSLVKELIEMHGGEITVESRYIKDNPYQHGTLFTITMPKGTDHFINMKGVEFIEENEIQQSISESWLVQMQSVLDVKAEQSEEVSTGATEQSDISKSTILIVEDNPEMRNFLFYLLKDIYNVHLAVNGQEGLTMAREIKPDVIVTDVMMPVMDGYEMTKRIKKDDDLKLIPVIMLTAKAEIAEKIEGLEYGADDYLAKPFNSRELLTRIKTSMKMNMLQKELVELNKNLENKVKDQLNIILKAEKLHRFLPPQLVDPIIKGERDITFEPERKKLTMFFSDIVDFTRIADALEPEDMANLLNTYFERMHEIVKKYDGTLAQIEGDGLYIFFGAPDFTNDNDHALRCVEMAIDMQNEMEVLRKKWFEEGIDETLEIRCGINTGMATVGAYGSEERREYTAMGLQTNLTARLESVCEPSQILISHSTWALVKGKIECDEKGQIEVKGFHRPIRIYRVLFG